MFVAKGRGPSGDWWRLAGWRGLFAEPCARLRVPDSGTEECFSELSFAVALPEETAVSLVQSFDAEGASLARRSVEGELDSPCEPA